VDADFDDGQIVDAPSRVLVLANETVGAVELLAALREIDRQGRAEYYVCVPANPVDTGQAEHKGAVWVWQATVDAAQARLDETLGILRAEGLTADGALGDYRPLRALEAGVASFHPDRIVISTHPKLTSPWLGQDVVGKARSTYHLPVRHIVAATPAEIVPPAAIP
jgi:GABA permease